MPHCVTCNTRFYGSGHHCGLHKSNFRGSRTREYYNYSSGFTYPGDIHFRTSAGTAGTVARRRHHNESNSAPALYNQNYSRQKYMDMPAINTALAHTLAQSFATLQDAHVVASLTYCITPSGAQTLIAEANLDREQCATCDMWFPNHAKLELHRWENPVGCEIHGVCMREEDVLWHATEERHERCFVAGCGTRFRREGGRKASAVQEHVRWRHSS